MCELHPYIASDPQSHNFYEPARLVKTPKALRFANMSFLKNSALILLATFSLSIGAMPILVEFEGLAPPGGEVIPSTPYSENGFSVTNSSITPSDGIFSGTSSRNTNGTDIFGWCGACDPSQKITVSHNEGSLFSFLSLDYALLDILSSVQTVSFTGFQFGGGTIETEIDFSQVWNTTSFTGFDSLSKLELILSDYPGSDVAIDNLVLATVPNVNTAILLSVALLGLRARRRGAHYYNG